MIAKAMGDVLNGDSILTGKLGSYEGNAGIFTVDPPPEDAPNPVVVIRGPVGGVRRGTRGSKGNIADYDVACYDDKLLSSARIRDIAWRIWNLLERAELTVNGYESVGVTAMPPRSAPDPDGFPGFIVGVRAHVLKQ